MIHFTPVHSRSRETYAVNHLRILTGGEEAVHTNYIHHIYAMLDAGAGTGSPFSYNPQNPTVFFPLPPPWLEDFAGCWKNPADAHPSNVPPYLGGSCRVVSCR
ncbi:hypothetical protein ACMFMG_001593 [Clarireedia jacksonii]